MELKNFDFKVMDLTNTPLGAIAPSNQTTMPQLSSIGVSGKLDNNAQMAVVGLGGPNDASVTIGVNVQNIGKYNFVINYFSGDMARPLSIDINGVNTGTIYMLSQTPDWNTSLIYTLPVTLSQTNNTIKFHGNGTNYAPFIGNIVIAPITSTLPAGVFDTANGVLSKGAIIDQSTGFVTGVGGSNKGMAVVSLGSIQMAKYLLSINYLSGDMGRPLDININGVDMGVYTLPKTIDWTVANALVFTLPININKSKSNSITFAGVSTATAPELGIFTLSILPPDPPAGYISIVGGSLQGGATVGSGQLYGYATNIGGTTDGSSTVTFNVSTAGLYNITLYYQNTNFQPGKTSTPTRYNQQPLMVDVNGVTMSTPYSIGISDSGRFTFGVSLNAGSNTLKFHGDGTNVAPNLAYFSFTPATPTLPKGVFDSATGTFSGGAAVDSSTGFVKNLGGTNKGTLVANNVSIPQPGQYGLIINYLSGDTSRSFRVDINGMSTGLVYNVPKTTDWTLASTLTYTIPISLYQNKNSIKFYGNGTIPAPYLGKFTLNIMPPPPPAGTYSATSGTLQGGASLGVADSYGFIINLGGTQDGASTVTVNAQTAGTYNLILFYMNTTTTSLPLAVDVIVGSTISSTTIYSVPPSPLGRFILPVTLVAGANKIKFHGDGTNPAPCLSIFTLSFVKK